MANLEAIVSRKTENDTQWKARQQADRENLMALQDAGVLEITSSAEAREVGGSASRRNSGASSRKNCMMHARTTDGVSPTMSI